MDGFKGDFCQNDIDECESNPCMFGSCLDQPRGFVCICNAGYTGAICDTVKETGFVAELTENAMEPWLIGVIIIAVAVALLLVILVALIACMRKGSSSKTLCGTPGRDNWHMRNNSFSNTSYEVNANDSHVTATDVATISSGRTTANGSPHSKHKYNGGFEGDSGTSSIDNGGPV